MASVFALIRPHPGAGWGHHPPEPSAFAAFARAQTCTGRVPDLGMVTIGARSRSARHGFAPAQSLDGRPVFHQAGAASRAR
jgi:hypothetical protein